MAETTTKPRRNPPDPNSAKYKLGKIADDIPPLVAAYKGVSTDEASKLDAAEVIDEIIHDEGIVNFFAKALRRKAGQEVSPSSMPIMTGA